MSFSGGSSGGDSAWDRRVSAEINRFRGGEAEKAVRFVDPDESAAPVVPMGSSLFATGTVDGYLSTDDSESYDHDTTIPAVPFDPDVNPPSDTTGLTGINITALPTNTLMTYSPDDLASEFADRLAASENLLMETREQLAKKDEFWTAKIRDIEVANGVLETEASVLRSELHDAREKISLFKKNLWVKTLDVETMKLIEDEVAEVIELKTREKENLRMLKDEEIRLVKSKHLQDIEDHTREMTEQMERIREAAYQGASLIATNALDVDTHEQGSNHDTGSPLLPYNSVSDPLDIIKTLKSIDTHLYEKVYGFRRLENTQRNPTVSPMTPQSTNLNSFTAFAPSGNPEDGFTDVLQSFKEKENEMVRAHLGDDNEADTVKQQQKELEEKYRQQVREMRVLREEVIDDVDDLLEAGAMQEQAISELMQPIFDQIGCVREKLQTLDTQSNEFEGRIVDGLSSQVILSDPVLTKVMSESKFAARLEAVIRENDQLKARLHSLGANEISSMGIKELDDRKTELRALVESLESQCELLNNQCVSLENQKAELKRDREALPYERKRSSTAALGEGSNSSDTSSIKEDESSSNDSMYDATHPIAYDDQIRGINDLVDEPEEETQEQYEIEKKQFTSTMKKEAQVASLVEQVLQYLECGTFVYRMVGGQVQKNFAYLKASRTAINICAVEEGKPNRKKSLQVIFLKDVKQIILGQYSEQFRVFLKSNNNTVVDPAELHKVPHTSESLEVYNTGLYFYRSYSLKLSKGRWANVICHSDNDFETWVMALHRITTFEPEFAKINDLIRVMRGYDSLEPPERDFCERCHIPPLQYLNSKTQCLKQEHKIYLTLYDVLLLSGFDLLHSQKVFELWLSMGWIENKIVYQIKYLEMFPEEASNLVARIDGERQKEKNKERDMLLYQQ